MQYFLPPRPQEIIIPDFTVEPAEDVDLNLQISSEQSFTTNSQNPNKKMFQLPNLKNRSNNSQPPKDLSMEINQQKHFQPNSENEFQSDKDDKENTWMQQDERWKPTNDAEDSNPIDFYIDQKSQTETDYSDDETTINSSNNPLV
jgi:hypothetical protein